MGFKRALVPASTAERISPSERSGVEIISVKRIDEAVRIALED
jgi:predicted ATP-dependent protease